MKKVYWCMLLLLVSLPTVLTATPPFYQMVYYSGKLDIKLKNDLGDEMSVINANSGGVYRLSKNVVTTIKMDAGDKLYYYTNGKKGKLILTAAAEMDGKLQLLSKL